MLCHISDRSKKQVRKGVNGLDEIEIIYQKYYKFVKGYAFTLCFDENLAEDITQETFFKAIKSYKKFNHKCKIETWLCQIAKNTFLNLKRPKQTENIDNFLNLVSDDNIEENLVKKDNVKNILSVSKDLESPYKEVFYMKTLGEFSYEVIAEVFEKSESWARVTYYRAKQKIIERMKDNE